MLTKAVLRRSKSKIRAKQSPPQTHILSAPTSVVVVPKSKFGGRMPCSDDGSPGYYSDPRRSWPTGDKGTPPPTPGFSSSPVSGLWFLVFGSGGKPGGRSGLTWDAWDTDDTVLYHGALVDTSYTKLLFLLHTYILHHLSALALGCQILRSASTCRVAAVYMYYICDILARSSYTQEVGCILQGPNIPRLHG